MQICTHLHIHQVIKFNTMKLRSVFVFINNMLITSRHLSVCRVSKIIWNSCKHFVCFGYKKTWQNGIFDHMARLSEEVIKYWSKIMSILLVTLLICDSTQILFFDVETIFQCLKYMPKLAWFNKRVVKTHYFSLKTKKNLRLDKKI